MVFELGKASDPLLQQALPVEEGILGDCDPSKPPTSAADYIRRVQKEAQQWPDVVVATEFESHGYSSNQTLKISSSNGCQPAPEGYAPSLYWVRTQEATFSDMRLRISRWKATRSVEEKLVKRKDLPDKTDENKWYRLCLGGRSVRADPSVMAVDEPMTDDEVTDVSDAVEVVGLDERCGDMEDVASSVMDAGAQSRQSLSSGLGDDMSEDQSIHGPSGVVLVDQVEIDDQVEQSEHVTTSAGAVTPLLSVCLSLDQPTVEQLFSFHVKWFRQRGFSYQQGVWMYALLACLEKPLSPGVCALIRDLARMCTSLRATVESPSDVTVTQLNLLISLVAGYFCQTDLADRRH